MNSYPLDFDPFPFIDNYHYQTIIASFFTWNLEPKSTTQFVQLPDGDYVSLEITTPKGWKDGDRSVLLIHGLCGSHRSPYQVRMAQKLQKRNVRAIRMNLRGSGSARGRAKKNYHGGMSDDVFQAVKAIKKETPKSPLTIVGFSLGGNLAVKLAGELGSEASNYFEKVIGINSPLDLHACAMKCQTKESEFFGKYFVSLMREETYFRHKNFSDLPIVEIPENLNIMGFDEIYTVPHFGFENIDEYYKQCSASTVVSSVDIPCKVLLAKDDPVIEWESIVNHPRSSKVEFFLTEKGGHMGYIGSPLSKRGIFWLDNLLLEWLFE